MTTTQPGRLGPAIAPVRFTLLAAALTTAALCASGCPQKDDGPKIITLEGKVEQLDLRPDGTGEITVLYHNEKQNQDVVGVAHITAETEVLIDGVVATARELRIGERVRGDVRVDKEGDQKTQTVVKIYVNRPKTSE